MWHMKMWTCSSINISESFSESFHLWVLQVVLRSTMICDHLSIRFAAPVVLALFYAMLMELEYRTCSESEQDQIQSLLEGICKTAGEGNDWHQICCFAKRYGRQNLANINSGIWMLHHCYVTRDWIEYRIERRNQIRKFHFCVSTLWLGFVIWC